MSRVAVYARESRDDYGQKYETIETQRDLLISYAKEHDLGEIFNIYIDNNKSGADFYREALVKLKEDAKENLFDVLLLKDLSRLGRDNGMTLTFVDFLENCGVRIIAADGKYDSLTGSDILGIQTWYNEHYLKDISKKIRQSLKFKIEKGDYIGSAPFGYKKSVENKNRLVILPYEAETIKYIYNRFLDGNSMTEIAESLNKMDIASPGGQKWNCANVGRILKNKVYIGDTVQNISKKVNYKSKKTVRLPESEWIITQNTHESVISRRDFEKAQKLFGTGHKKTKHVFTGLFFCGDCNMPMYAVKKENDIFYVCSSYHKSGKNVCSSHKVYESDIVHDIFSELMLLLNSEFIKKELVKLLSNDSINNEDIKNIDKRIKDTEKKLNMVYKDRLSEVITLDQYLLYKENLEKEKNLFINKKKTYEKPFKSLILHENFIEKDIDNKTAKIIVDKVIAYEKKQDLQVHIFYNFSKKNSINV